MAEIEKVKLPNDNTIYDIKDAKAIRGLASGTTSGHVVQFGADGYTVSDSGKSMSDKQDTIDSSHKLSADLVDNSTPTFATATQGGKADTAVQSVKVNGTALTPDSNKAVDITAIPASIVSAGALANGMTATTQTTSDDSTKVATTEFVHDVVDLLPSPMVFKGSLGTGGTITTLPTASSSNKGYVYKVITAGIYASQSAKVGDTFISDGSAWVLIPSGDEPSGTVTSVGVTNGGGLTVSGSPITSSGTITVGHSNSVTAKTSSSVKKIAYDANGHITGSSELSTAESNALASGIDSAKVTQIETNKNNISLNKNALANIINTSGKNNLQLLYDVGYTTTINNVTYIVNSDYSITANGTAQGQSRFDIAAYTPRINDVMSGATGGSPTTYFMYLRAGASDYCYNGGVIIDTDDVGVSRTISIVVGDGTQMDNVVFKPMMTNIDLWTISTNYEPYCPTLADLYALVKSYHSGT